MLIPKADRKAIHELVHHRGRSRRKEGLQPSQARRHRHQEPVRHQGLPVVDLPRIPQDSLLMAVLLLHPHP
ncbi:hypothetical protein SNOG_07750 [Parastagonospora nodorum SN15]|uniref:Uncharacterized protein n=1 Tax=Phaeosphaeria nodorum (strain SN15 / ATCC MYA-4574 / FGSC 10173) TaxID=321614 RepID=Q0UKG4_PHANO|nr:hypothetical protein SNOG_07750 [Parastagonospora nodorum SN15]EAT85216.2 hypothetical protein SNOG_07750 [Parastagonospora nodorum SN15]